MRLLRRAARLRHSLSLIRDRRGVDTVATRADFGRADAALARVALYCAEQPYAASCPSGATSEMAILLNSREPSQLLNRMEHDPLCALQRRVLNVGDGLKR
jgi:hypothetical protein